MVNRQSWAACSLVDWFVCMSVAKEIVNIIVVEKTLLSNKPYVMSLNCQVHVRPPFVGNISVVGRGYTGSYL